MLSSFHDRSGTRPSEEDQRPDISNMKTVASNKIELQPKRQKQLPATRNNATLHHICGNIVAGNCCRQQSCLQSLTQVCMGGKNNRKYCSRQIIGGGGGGGNDAQADNNEQLDWKRTVEHLSLPLTVVLARRY